MICRRSSAGEWPGAAAGKAPQHGEIGGVERVQRRIIAVNGRSKAAVVS